MEVFEAIEILNDSMPKGVNCLDELTFFKHTYIRGRRQRGHGSNYAPALFQMRYGINMKQVLLVLSGQRMPWKDSIMPCNRCLHVITQ